jgi:hypothetical protein
VLVATEASTVSKATLIKDKTEKKDISSKRLFTVLN